MQFKINSLYPLSTFPLQALYRGSNKCQDIHPSSTKSMVFYSNNSNSKVTPTSLEKWTFSNSSRTIQSLRDKSRFCLSLVIRTQVCVLCLFGSSVSEKLFQTLRLNSLPIHKSLQFFFRFRKFIFITFKFPTIKTHLHLYPALVFMSPSYLSCARAPRAQHMNRADY